MRKRSRISSELFAFRTDFSESRRNNVGKSQLPSICICCPEILFRLHSKIQETAGTPAPVGTCNQVKGNGDKRSGLLHC